MTIPNQTNSHQSITHPQNLQDPEMKKKITAKTMKLTKKNSNCNQFMPRVIIFNQALLTVWRTVELHLMAYK